MKNAVVTGSSGFIGSFVSQRLLNEGWTVIGIDDLNNYYEPKLKIDRQNRLLEHNNFSVINDKIESIDLLNDLFSDKRPSLVIHLAAQAGVRFSLNNPESYLESNLKGSFAVLEAARNYKPKHLMIASSSSVYGANPTLSLKENDKTDNQISFYAATKKAIENMAHSYSHIHDIPITIMRLFSVYGPWNRPDMALFKFTESILKGKPIDVYNHGNMQRDFIYIEDLIEAIYILTSCMPSIQRDGLVNSFDSISPVAPFRIVNIGNSKAIKICDYIKEIEKALKMKAKKNFIPIQDGDMENTCADIKLLENLTGYRPSTPISVGISKFIRWYKSYYK